MNFLAIVFNTDEQASKQWVATILFSLMTVTLWTITLLFGGFDLAIYIVAMTALCGLVFVTPSAGIPVIILSTMWFQRWFTLQPIIIGDITLKLYPIDLVFGATVLGLVFAKLFGKANPKLHIRKIDKALLFFMGLVTLYLGRSILDNTAEFELAFSSFKNYAFYAFLYFLVTYTVQDLKTLKEHIKVLFIAGYGLIGFVLVGIFRGQGLWTEYNPLSTEGVRLLSFPHAYYLSSILIITLIFLLYRLRPERQTVLTMWLQLVGVLGSLMRHLWLALFAAAMFLFIVLPKKAKGLLLKFFTKNAAVLFILGLVVAFVFVIFPLSPISNRIQDVTDPLASRAQSLARSTADSSARWRFFSWRAARESIIEAPIFGVGFGKELIVEFDTYRVTIPMRDLHNSLLVMLVQMGIVGLLPFLYLLWLLIKAGYASWRVRGIFYPYHLAFFSALVVFFVSSFTQPYFETNFTGIFFWMFMGYFIVSLRISRTETAFLTQQGK